MRIPKFNRTPFWVWCVVLWLMALLVVGLSSGYNYYLEQPAILRLAQAVGMVAPFGIVVGLTFKL